MDEWVQIGVRRARIINVYKEGQRGIDPQEGIQLARQAGANFSQEAGQYLLTHQADIPREWQFFELLFPDWVVSAHWVEEGASACAVLGCDFNGDHDWVQGEQSLSHWLIVMDRFIALEEA